MNRKITVLIVIILITTFFNSCFITYCDYARRYETYEFEGIVKEKIFEAENHGLKAIVVLTKKKETENIYLSGDRSGLYNYLIEGDSIKKRKGTFLTQVKKENQNVVSFDIDFPCSK